MLLVDAETKFWTRSITSLLGPGIHINPDSVFQESEIGGDVPAITSVDIPPPFQTPDEMYIAKRISVPINIPGVHICTYNIAICGYGLDIGKLNQQLGKQLIESYVIVKKYIEGLEKTQKLPESMVEPIVVQWDQETMLKLAELTTTPSIQELLSVHESNIKWSGKLEELKTANAIVGSHKSQLPDDLLEFFRHDSQKKLIRPLPELHRKLLNATATLPIVSRLDDILDSIEGHQVTVIRAGTGSGKSTVIPAAIMATGARLIVSQPRRIAARSIAERTTRTLGVPLGVNVGYRMRYASIPMQTVGAGVEFVTTGFLLSHMRHDPLLSGFTHVIIDEAHESTVENELTMALMVPILAQRPELKLVIMSATIDEAKFRKYYQKHKLTVAMPLPVETERPFPVKQFDLNDIVGTKLGHHEKIPTSEMRTITSEVNVREPTEQGIQDIPYDFMSNLINNLFAAKPGIMLVFLPGII